MFGARTVDVDVRRSLATPVLLDVGSEVVAEADVTQEDVEQLAAASYL